MNNEEFKGTRYFLNIPAEVAHDTRIKRDKAILLFGEIYSMLNVTGAFYMSNKELAKRLRCKTVKPVKEALNELESLGYIKREKIIDQTTGAIIGRKITSDWRPGIAKEPDLGSEENRGVGTSRTEDKVREEPLIEHNNRSINRTNNKYSSTNVEQRISNSNIEKDFEKIWELYPNKKGKKQAFSHYKKWRKESVNHTNDYLQKKLDTYLNYCNQNRNWYHPMNGSTWFNGRFDDDYKVKVKAVEPASGGYDTSQNIMDIPDDELPF